MADRGLKPISDTRFPRTARLLASTDFQRVFAKPRRSADAYFTVLACDARQEHARLGLAISKKQARRAVDRNRLKRLSREAFRVSRDQLKGLDLVIMARRAALTADNRTLCHALARHFERISRPSPKAL